MADNGVISGDFAPVTIILAIVGSIGKKRLLTQTPE
jgi:hypothetical protein